MKLRDVTSADLKGHALPWACDLPLPRKRVGAAGLGCYNGDLLSTNHRHVSKVVNGELRQTKNPWLEEWERVVGLPTLDRQKPPRLDPGSAIVIVFRFRFRTNSADVDGCVKTMQDLVCARLGRDLKGSTMVQRMRKDGTPALRAGKPVFDPPPHFDDKGVTLLVASKTIDARDDGVHVLVDWADDALAGELENAILGRARNAWGYPLPRTDPLKRAALTALLGG